MNNQFGLDADYFRRKLERVLRDVNSYKPDEMARELARMARTADEEVLREEEFAQQSAPVAAPEGWMPVPVEPNEQMLAAGLDRHLPQTMSGERLALLYRAMLAAAPPAAEQPHSTTSDQYRAELYDEVWTQARLIGYGNVTEALADLERRKAAERERIERDEPGTILVSCELLRELARIFEVVTHSEQVPNDLSQQAAAALIATRATLAGGEA